MKRIISIGFIVLCSKLTHATQLFSGTDTNSSLEFDSCKSMPQPSAQKAEAIADQNAMQFCSALHLRPARATPFIISTGSCVTAGRGYALHESISLTATAQYNCR